MGDVTAVMMDVITEKSGHVVTPMAVSVCLTPAAPAPLPIPYPVLGSSSDGIIDPPMRTKINGAPIGTVGSCIKDCHGNEPGTLKEVVSLNTTGPCFIIMGAPVVLCELGMMGITGSPCISNKAITVGAPANASDASGTGGAGDGGGGGSGAGGDGHGPGGPSGGGGSGGDGTNTGASGTSSAFHPAGCTQEGHPIDVATGYVVDRAVDLSTAGLLPVVWMRRYSSQRRGEKAGALGPGWAHEYDEWIAREEHATTFRSGDGRSIFFGKLEPGASAYHRRERLQLTAEAGGGFLVYSPETRLTRVFDTPGGDGRARLRAIRDAYDNAVRLDYDGSRLVRLTDTAGRELRVRWERSRIVRLEVRAEGRLEQWVDYAYSAAGCLTTATDALGNAEAYEYDRFDRMTAATLKNGVRFEYEYEANTGRCARTWGPNGLYAVALHADRGARTTQVDAEEPRVYTWNELGAVTRAATGDGEILEERSYDDDGRLVARVNGAGEGDQIWYDELGAPIRVVDAAGNTTAWEYQGGLVTREVRQDGQITRYGYDAKGALTAVAYPSGLTYALGYDDRGRLTSVQGAGGVVARYEYDGRHNLIAETDALGALTTYEYDAMGRPVARRDALGRTMRVTYDRLGRPVVLRRADGTTVHRAYDAMGNLVRVIDPAGHASQMEYGGTGVLTRMTQADGRSFTFKYSSKERLREIKNPRGETYTFEYDTAGRLASERTFDGRVFSFHYATSGRLSRVEQADGTARELTYDRLGNLTLDRTADSDITYQRDRAGRLLAAILEERGGGTVATSVERDALGRVVAEVQGDRRLGYEYDGHNRRTARTMPDGRTTRFAYDARGDLAAVEHDGYRLAVERDAAGREIRRSSEHGLFEVRSAYDALDRLVEQRASAASPGEGARAVLAQRLFRYDALGRVRQVDDGRSGTARYTYDRAGQLLEADHAARREVFRYDAAGALERVLAALPGAAADPRWELSPGNVLARTADARYAYDARGRRIARVSLRKSERGEPEVTAYTWDARDRLREVRLPDGTGVRFTYDAFGRRVRKRVVAADGSPLAQVEYLWDGRALAAEVDDRRGPRCFVHAPGTFVPLLQAEHGEVYAYVNDPLGTPKELVDRAGVVAWSATHRAWGELAEVRRDPASEARRPKASVSSPFRLLGQYADEETGLCYAMCRYLDPEVGRWCSPDPLGFAGGADLFGFNGSPTVDVDPLGLSTAGDQGTALGNSIVSAGGGGKMQRIGDGVTGMGLPQCQAVEAAQAAVHATGLRTGPPINMPNGDVIIPSVMPGPQRPVLVVSPSGAVQPGRADLGIDMSSFPPKMTAGNVGPW